MAKASNQAFSFEGVSLRRGDAEILRNLTWQLGRGRLAAVLGANGSGKTTLLRVLAGYLWPTRGRVDVLGERLGATDVRQLRRRLALVDPAGRFGVDERLTAEQVVQTGFFGSLALYDPVAPTQAERARHLLEMVGLSPAANRSFGVLSTGERRRCLLARALAADPELLLLDEPTAGLDPPGREQLLATLPRLRRAHRDLAIVLVTHHAEEITADTDE
ncbi:MAG: ATP-binding cassette domain-containing protein, partial [Phycisphaerae bacterium]|nr:ATP-binding cassette domain-containing protein [Phycisphaerae bacterium]